MTAEKKAFVSYDDAKKIVKKAGILTPTQYKAWKDKKDHQLPYDADKVYGKEFIGWDDFLGRNKASFVEQQTHEKKKAVTITEGVISLKEAAVICPAILTDTKLNKLSERYKQVNTYKVIENIQKTMDGWYISYVKETHIRDQKLRPYTHHVVKLENFKYKMPGTGDKIQLVISNSHNGVSKFEFYFGVFRIICSNGLIVWDKKFGGINKKHFTDYETINQYIVECVGQSKKLIELFNVFNKRILTKAEKIDLAIKGLHSRYQYKNSYIELMYDELKVRYDIEAIIKPMRDEDEGNSLWLVFNIIQERITKGEYYAKVDSGLSKANPIKNTHLDIQFNKKFWEYAMALVESAEEVK